MFKRSALLRQDRLQQAKEQRADGRAVECTGFENRQRGNLFGGSNPSLPAIFYSSRTHESKPFYPRRITPTCRVLPAAKTTNNGLMSKKTEL